MYWPRVYKLLIGRYPEGSVHQVLAPATERGMISSTPELYFRPAKYNRLYGLTLRATEVILVSSNAVFSWHPKCKNTEYSQRVEGAQTLKGIWCQLWYLVVTQVSVKKCRKRETWNKEQRDTWKMKQRSKQATKRTATEVVADPWNGAEYILSSNLLTSCAVSYKGKRPQLGSPWWRSAPVVWNQTYTQTIEERH